MKSECGCSDRPEHRPGNRCRGAAAGGRKARRTAPDDDLPVELIDAWPTLDDADRNRIMAIVRESRHRVAQTLQDATGEP